MIKVAQEFTAKPRAICGEIVAMALSATPNEIAQCTAVAIFLRPSKAVADAAKVAEVSPNPSKKAKTSEEVQSVRLRHILLKHRGCKDVNDVVRTKVEVRTEAEAETTLRGALRELQREAREARIPADPKRAATAYLQPSPRFIKLCKELSECATAKNGGGMLGDMGWLDERALQSFGPVFRDISKALQVGQWSDVVRTEHGVHILQKIA